MKASRTAGARERAAGDGAEPEEVRSWIVRTFTLVEDDRILLILVAFTNAMIELGLLSAMVLILVVSLILLKRRPAIQAERA